MAIKNYIPFFLCLLSFLKIEISKAQLGYNTGDNFCQEQSIEFENTSSLMGSYEWDFCPENFSETPSTSSLLTISSLVENRGYSLFNDDGTWYGFATDKNDDELYRFTFNADPTSPPGFENIPDPSGYLSGPDGIAITKVGSLYYGFIGYSKLNGDQLLRLDFGNSLDNDPTIVQIGNFGLPGRFWDVRTAVDEGNNLLISAYHNSSRLYVLNYRDSYTNTLDPEHIIFHDLGVGTGLFTGIDIIKIDDSWIAFIVAQSDEIYVLRFDNGLLGSYSLVNQYLFTEIDAPTKIRVIKSGGNHYGIVTTNTGPTSIVNFKDVLTTTPEIVSNSGIYDFRGVDARKYNGEVIIQGSISGNLSQNVLSNECGSSLDYFLGFDPPVIEFSDPGEFPIDLIALDSNNFSQFFTDTIDITSETAPNISFVTDNACIESSGNFNPNLTGLPTYSWDFDNDQMEDSDDESPEVKFDTLGGTGEYIVRLDVNDGTCDNFVRDTIKIYPEPPDPTFTLNASVFCQDVDIGLSNTTDETGYDDVLSYSWTITDLGVLNQDEPSVSFANTGAKDISVSSSLPGCTSNPTQQDITVQGAPAASFSVEDNCLGVLTNYENESASGLDYAWTFGDGFESTLENPSHEYGMAGEFTTTLVVTDDIGCATTVQETLQVFPNPEPGFQYGLICEDDSVIFQDTSTVENGDVEAWEWYINDVLVSNLKDPKLSFSSSGDFVVRQVVSGTGECAVTNERTVSILEAPVPSFDIVSACVGESFTLLNTSVEGSYLSREFLFGDQVFEEDTVLLEISSPGTYEVTLTLGNKNLCSTTLTKSFTVTAPPEFNIQSQNICANESTILEDLSTSNDQIISRTWSVNGEEIGNGAQVNYLFGNAGSYDLSLKLITENGCEYSYGQSITILDPPTAEIQASSDYAILGNSIQFSSLSSSDSIYWYLMGDSLRSDSTFSRLFNEEGTFNFSQVVVAEDGCLDTASLDILVATPDVDLRLMSFEIIDDGSGFGQVIAAVFNESNLPIEDIEFTLTLDNALPLKERFTNRIGIRQSGIFNLNTSIPLSQNFVSTVCLQVTSPISEVDATPFNNENCLTQEKKAVIEPPFPNPASGELTINIVLPAEENVSFRMLDMTGKQKLNKSYPEKFSGLATFILELQEIPPGLYFLEITTGDRVNVSRIAVK